MDEQRLLAVLQKLNDDAHAVLRTMRTLVEDGVAFETLEVMYAKELKERHEASLEIIEEVRKRKFSDFALEQALAFNDVTEKTLGLIMEAV